MADQRDWLVGSTVDLVVKASVPRTNTPATPSGGVVLDALFVGTTPVALPTERAFKRVTEGEYLFKLDTTGFGAGVYTWRVRAIDTTYGTGVREDTFVLRAQFG